MQSELREPRANRPGLMTASPMILRGVTGFFGIPRNPVASITTPAKVCPRILRMAASPVPMSSCRMTFPPTMVKEHSPPVHIHQ